MNKNPNRCPDCGFMLRGPNHNEGHHHKGHRDFTGKQSKNVSRSNPMHGIKTNMGNPRDHGSSCSCYLCKKR